MILLGQYGEIHTDNKLLTLLLLRKVVLTSTAYLFGAGLAKVA